MVQHTSKFSKSLYRLANLFHYSINLLFKSFFAFSKAHTKDALKWLHVFEKRDEGSESANSSSDGSGLVDEDSRPVLVCMTFADRLLAEMMDDGRYDRVTAKRKIENHFKVDLLYHSSCEKGPMGGAPCMVLVKKGKRAVHHTLCGKSLFATLALGGCSLK